MKQIGEIELGKICAHVQIVGQQHIETEGLMEPWGKIRRQRLWL
jgi:hypothetical protein